ncbi:MAG: NAD-dependent epimerase/dehydratase family protein [Pirellulaceae bacterium]
MNRVLVTGAHGFIGRHVVSQLLQAGRDVVCLDYRKPDGVSMGETWITADLLDTAQCVGLLADLQATHWMHFAWSTIPGEYWTSLDNVRWVEASTVLLRAFVRFGGQRVVMAGTCAEYDWNYGYCSESFTPQHPATLYGTCKHALQSILAAYARQVGLSAAWGRIFFLYGPHEHPTRLVASVIRALLQNQEALCSHGEQVRDFLYVEDVASAFVALLESRVTGPVNIASGRPRTLREVVETIADKMKRRELLRWGAIGTVSSEPPVLLADTRRLFSEVGWRPVYDLHEGLDQTIAWWRRLAP